MTAVTTGRRGGAHRRPRRPLVESLVELHTGAAELGQILLVSVACWALPVAIVVVAISTRGATT